MSVVHVLKLNMLTVTMKTLMFVVLLGIHGAAAVTHSMTYIVTAVSGLNDFPEYTEVGQVDGQEFVHYDSNLKKMVPKTAWIEKNVDADYWKGETERNINTQQVFKGNIAIAMQRFNQTGGVHIFQLMVGCEWDDETGQLNGNYQFGYDGEDFVSFDLKTKTWIAPTPQAVITKHKWDNNKGWIAQTENYLTQICPEWLKKYVNYGRSSLMRTELPSMSLLQKRGSKVSCHATGFYPDRAMMFWRKDGEEHHEGVDQGESLPNHDGTFQMSVDLDLSSVRPEDREKYDCVFQLAGVKEDQIIKLENEKFPVGPVVGGVLGLVLLAGGIALFMLFRRRNNAVYKHTSTSDTSSSSAEDPDSKKETTEEQKVMIETRQ